MSRNPKVLAQAIGQVDATAFRAWLGDSQVVGAAGVPLVFELWGGLHTPNNWANFAL
jgi:hypothetical protein